MESFNQKKWDSSSLPPFNPIQDNLSVSHKNVLRGLHYQITSPQAKLIRVLSGAVFDVFVDLRKSSPTCSQWEGVILGHSDLSLFVPRGFAHGFYSLQDSTIFSYKVDNPYDKSGERGLVWSDPHLNIRWPPSTQPLISEKDLLLPTLDKADLFE